jgi:large subunit ribosomal protein L18
MRKLNRKELRQARHQRLRKKVQGTAERPRLAVCATLKHIYVQAIDDDRGHTLAAISTLDKELRAQNIKPNLAGAQTLGKAVADQVKALGISAVVFDRGGFKFHGRVKALADAAREAGLQF